MEDLPQKDSAFFSKRRYLAQKHGKGCRMDAVACTKDASCLPTNAKQQQRKGIELGAGKDGACLLF